MYGQKYVWSSISLIFFQKADFDISCKLSPLWVGGGGGVRGGGHA